MQNLFHLKEKQTTVKTEIIAGLTTFMTLSHILVVNPSVLGSSGMDKGAVFTATVLVSAFASFLMGFLANLPFVLSAGMGLNAYFAYTVCGQMGISWQTALAAVFAEGLIFILLSLTNVREAIFNAIPSTLKYSVTVGIGLFITFIGLQNADIVVDSSTLVGIFSFSSSIKNGTFHTEGVTVLLALAGTLITSVLVIRKVKGNILLGILISWGLGIICQLTGLYIPAPESGFNSLLPSGILSMPASVAPTFLKMSLEGVDLISFLTIMFAFLFVDMFDTIGTLIGCASKSGMLDENGKLPSIRKALFADAAGTTAGAMLGTSTITTLVESSAGIAEGGRTGLTSIVAGFLCLLSLFFSPVFLSIPSYATAPALIMVGFMMIQQIVKIDFEDPQEAIPAFISITAMPFTYSISEGISFGIISYVILNLVTGRKDKLNPLMYFLCALFILKYIFI